MSDVQYELEVKWAVEAIQRLAGVDRLTAVRLLISVDEELRRKPKLVMEMCRA